MDLNFKFNIFCKFTLQSILLNNIGVSSEELFCVSHHTNRHLTVLSIHSSVEALCFIEEEKTLLLLPKRRDEKAIVAGSSCVIA